MKGRNPGLWLVAALLIAVMAFGGSWSQAQAVDPTSSEMVSDSNVATAVEEPLGCPICDLFPDPGPDVPCVSFTIIVVDDESGVATVHRVRVPAEEAL